MKQIMLIIAGALLGVILFQFLFYKCESGKKDKEIAAVSQLLKDCQQAPVRIDTVIVSNILKDTIYLQYTYRVIDTVNFSEAIDWIDQTVEKREYNGTYVHPQFEVDWTAKVTGTLDKLTINPPSMIKSLVITKEKTVPVITEVDKPYRPKSHLWANVGGFYSKNTQGIDVGLMYAHKSGIGFRAGIGTDFKNLLYTGGFMFKLM